VEATGELSILPEEKEANGKLVELLDLPIAAWEKIFYLDWFRLDRIFNARNCDDIV
jgi:hypothetical protein